MRQRGTKDHSHLVAKTLRSNDGDFIADTLVGFEVKGELGVIAFNDHFCRLLDSLTMNVSDMKSTTGSNCGTFVRTRPMLTVSMVMRQFVILQIADILA